MKVLVLFAFAVVAPLLTSCQSGNPSRLAGGLLKSQSASSTGHAGSTGVAGYEGTSGSTKSRGTATPFVPGPVPESAPYVPPNRYWGYGGGYSKTRPEGAGAADGQNFLKYGYNRCWRGGYRYSSSCYTGYDSCYTPSYGGGRYYGYGASCAPYSSPRYSYWR